MKIAILGQGITAKALHLNAQRLNYDVTDIQSADLIVASPGIANKDLPKANQPIISEVEFAYRLLKKQSTSPILIGVTGTNGKSTVTALLSHLLDAPAVGNFGDPLINYVDTPHAILVIELSSYQLERTIEFNPDIAIMLNITPDHLERHKTLEDYIFQKSKIIQNQTKENVLIYYEKDDALAKIAQNSKSAIGFSLESDEKEYAAQSQLLGDHNVLNNIAALKAVKVVHKLQHNKKASNQFSNKLDDNSIQKLKDFKSLEHRLEKVAEFNNRLFINDSKSTNPESTLIAVEAFKQPIQLILCGDDKGLDLDDFLQTLTTKIQTVKSIITFGKIANRLIEIITKINPSFTVYKTETLLECCQKAYQLSSQNDVILFSPASSSFDSFKNFEDRGSQFKQTIQIIQNIMRDEKVMSE